MTRRSAQRLTRIQAWLVGLAVLWGIGLVLVGAFVPAYTVAATGSAAGEGRQTHTVTLLAENGATVLVLLAAPALIAVVVGVLLSVPERGRLARALMWGLIAAMFLVSVVSIASIGLFLLPVPTLLTVAASRGPKTSRLSSRQRAVGQAP